MEETYQNPVEIDELPVIAATVPVTEDVKDDAVREMKESLEEFKKEYNLIRDNVLDMLPILKDFKGLLQRKSLFERSPYIYLSILAKEIKTDILREVASKLLEPGDDIREIKEDIKSFKDSTLDKFYALTDDLEILKSERVVVNEHLELTDRNLKDVRDEVSLKAPFNMMNSIAEKLNTKAPLAELHELEEKVKICPTSEQVRALNREIETLNSQISAFASKELVFQMEEGIEKKVTTEIEKYLKTDVFIEEMEHVKGQFKDAQVLIDYQKDKQEKITSQFRHEIAKLNKNLTSKPWISDIDIVMGYVSEKSSVKDLDRFKQDVNPKLEFFEEKVDIFGTQIKAFERVLERYDEILLEKASKDDIDKLKSIHPSFLQVTDFNTHKEFVLKRVKELEVKSENHLTGLDFVEKKLKSFKSTYKIFNKDMKTFLNLYNSLGDIKEQISAKADKSDILSVIDTTGRKEDVVQATQAIENLHKQLEMHVMLHLAVIRTMLKSAEPAAVKNRQRVELYRSTSSLLN